jgi:hypothetical protein
VIRGAWAVIANGERRGSTRRLSSQFAAGCPQLENALLRFDRYRKAAEHGIRRPAMNSGFGTAYGAIHGVLRAGANPTGIRAVSFIDAISTTETSLLCALA